jgi:hypothetical protein
MLSLLYTSRSRLAADDAAGQLKAILDTAVPRNQSRDLTGTLVYTGTDFAQILEGPEEGVDEVMASILIDPRHEDVAIVRREAITARSFPNWGMALIGFDAATASHIGAIRAAADEAALSQAVEAVMRWMRRGAAEKRLPPG